MSEIDVKWLTCIWISFKTTMYDCGRDPSRLDGDPAEHIIINY